MGMHSAFFVPAKYGVMPEILQPHLLSRGNGLLESLSFLAVILGTVSGGVLSYLFPRDEEYVHRRDPAGARGRRGAGQLADPADAGRQPDAAVPAPTSTARSSTALRTLLDVAAAGLAVIGIAFFTFMVAFMRADGVHARRVAESALGRVEDQR